MIVQAVSNTSTLIRFYRAKSFLSLFKNAYKSIIVPTDCWIELQRKPEEPENLLMKKDMPNFLYVERPSQAEVTLAHKLVLAMQNVGSGLDFPEAIAIAMAHIRQIPHVLSEDGIARATPYFVTVFPKVYNALDVLGSLFEMKIISVSKEEFLEQIRKFEGETQEEVRQRQLTRLLEKLFGQK